ncbi:MAG: transcriptional regulator [Thaumarchaeota archaeon]|nr:transcriptional regulator [Nitrososphaerota archaeon]
MKKVSVFTFNGAKSILEGTDSAVWNVIDGLKKKKRLQEIENGKYLLVPARAGLEGYWSEDPWLIVPQLIDEYYIGFWTAMKFWDMTEQIPYTVFVATPKRKKNRILKYRKQKFQFVTISKKKFFGYVELKIGKNNHFNISSKEKTIVDGLTHPEYCGGIVEVTKAMWYMQKEVDWTEVYQLTKKIGINVVLRRLGYLLTILDFEQNLSEKIKKEIVSYPYSFLDPTAAKTKIAYSKNFGLILNRTKDELLNWMDY